MLDKIRRTKGFRLWAYIFFVYLLSFVLFLILISGSSWAWFGLLYIAIIVSLLVSLIYLVLLLKIIFDLYKWCFLDRPKSVYDLWFVLYTLFFLLVIFYFLPYMCSLPGCQRDNCFFVCDFFNLF